MRTGFCACDGPRAVLGPQRLALGTALETSYAHRPVHPLRPGTGRGPLVNHTVGRALDLFGIENDLLKRWCKPEWNGHPSGIFALVPGIVAVPLRLSRRAQPLQISQEEEPVNESQQKRKERERKEQESKNGYPIHTEPARGARP
jgi:hypothetical protein